MATIAVFCGANAGDDAKFSTAAETLAQWLANRGDTLVYGGGGVGLMGVLAQAMLRAGGRVIGIMPENLAARGAAQAGLTEFHIVPNMAIRKQEMLAQADGCIALPGGPGTLEEISEAFSWARIGDNDAPCAFYNVAGYYDELAAFFDQMVTHQFLTEADRTKLLFSDDLAAIGQFMADYQPPTIRQYPAGQ